MKLTHRPLQIRDKGYKLFKYMLTVEFSTGDTTCDVIERYNAIRNWCNDTFGPSCEHELYMALATASKPVNDQWAWSASIYQSRIYLTSDDSLNWLLLKFSEN